MKNEKLKITKKAKGNGAFFSYCLMFFLCLSAITPSFGFDINELGDFSSRSIIENGIFNRQTITQEQRDLLKSKKLTPDAKCMIEQIKKGNYENVKLLLDAKVNPNEHYMADFPIYIAARENKFDILKLLYENNAKLNKGLYSELYEAIKNKNKEMAQYLLDRGAEVNYSDGFSSNTILYIALKNEMYDIAHQIILKGAYADTRSIKYIKSHKLEYLVPQQ